jgi:hypothetical protein
MWVVIEDKAPVVTEKVIKGRGAAGPPAVADGGWYAR